jgi:hypothetical protein
MNPNLPPKKIARYFTAGKAVFLFALLAFATPSSALDLSGITENDAAAFRSAVEAEGGSVNGEPCVITADGPDGKVQRLISFPTTESFVNLPVDTIAATWTMSGSIRIEAMPFGKAGGGGGMFGLHFGPNDAILALSVDKWSKLKAPQFFSGLTCLLPESEFKEADVPQVGSWQKISLGLDGAQWKLKVGDSFEKGGTIENDTRGVLGRRKKLFMRVGNFSGTATLPEISESN